MSKILLTIKLILVVFVFSFYNKFVEVKMKLLEPFSGYKLASGHHYFHLALFFATWSVRGDQSAVSGQSEESDYFVFAFNLLRWTHLAVFFLSFPNYIASWTSRNTMADPARNQLNGGSGEVQF